MKKILNLPSPLQLNILGPGLVTQQRQQITEGVDGSQSVKSTYITAIRPVSILPNVIELSYYSNTMLLYYVMDSVVGNTRASSSCLSFRIIYFNLLYWNTLHYCNSHYIFSVTALYAELQSQINDPVAIAENNITVFQSGLLERSCKLCDILRYEFIFCRPCQQLRDVILETIQNLSHTGIFAQKEVRVHFDE